MKFDELDAKLRVYETAHDLCVLPGIFMVARIDGRGFTRLTKEKHPFERPFDVRFRDYMIATTDHVLQCGFRAIYGYTQSDEISILFHRDETGFGRKLRKFNSILAGEASARFSLLLGDIAAFDCRIVQLPTLNTVVDYFRWRHEDAHRNALNAHCYWMLRKAGATAVDATEQLRTVSIAQKNELLYQQSGVNFNDLPNWQKRGIGLYWADYQKEALNPRTQTVMTTMRRRLTVDLNVPMRDDYSRFLRALVLENHPDLG